MATIVLAPGAWLGKWAWERVTPELEGAGHTVYPVTLPGLADRLGELSPKVGLMSHVNDLVGFCDRIDMKRGIILGHSYAGAVVGGVARRIPSRLKAQVYIDTLPIDEGKALLGVFSPTGRSKFEDAVVTWDGTRVWPMPERLGDQAPVEGLTADDLQLLRKRGTPQPAFTFEESLSGPYEAGRYPKNHAISCDENEASAASGKAEFLAGHPDWTYRSLPICHWPMLSSPRELAAHIDAIARS